jgi:ketosteroid isomerase-like protein
MRRLLIGCALVAVVGSLAVCTGSGTGSQAEKALQRKADKWEIDQIERKFHEATTKKDIDLMMSLWAPNSTLTVGPGETAVGVAEVRQFWLEKSVAFEPGTHWVSDHPAYKVEITVNGDRGTLHFECHYVDAETGDVVAVTAADLDVARVDGAWLITNMIGGTADLQL